MGKRRCIVPGSFDPMTVGHLAIVLKASEIFDEVFVAILNNSDKKGTFTLAERKQIAESTCSIVPNAKVITADGLLVDLAKRLDIRHIVKGVRNTIDFEYEQNMAKINNALAPDIQTIYIPCDPSFEIVSSTFVKELYKNDKNIDAYVHADAIEILKNK